MCPHYCIADYFTTQSIDLWCTALAKNKTWSKTSWKELKLVIIWMINVLFYHVSTCPCAYERDGEGEKHKTRQGRVYQTLFLLYVADTRYKWLVVACGRWSETGHKELYDCTKNQLLWDLVGCRGDQQFGRCWLVGEHLQTILQGKTAKRAECKLW